MKKLLKKITSLALALCMMLSPVPVFAEEGAVIKGGTASGYAGNTVTINFTAENLKNLAALDMDVYYDPAVLTLSTATSSGFSGASVDINTSTEGCVSMSMASAKGFSGSLTVLTLKFKISSTAKPGDYGVFVAIGDAFDASLNPVSIARRDGKITVLERAASTPTITIYGSASPGSLEQGGETKITYYSYTLYNLASGVFEFTYDPELFEFVEFGTYASMQTPDAVYSVNSDRAGYVKVAYVSSTAVKTGNLFFIKLRAIKDCDATSTVEMTPSSLYAQDLSPINGSKRTTSITITKKYVEPEPEDHPDFWTELPEKIVEGKEFEALVKIGDSGVAAGDFTVGYDTGDFSCVSVTPSDEVSADGGSVTINPGYANGKIKFSFINVNGISKSQSLLVLKFVPVGTGAYFSEITTAGTAVYDADFREVLLDYLSAEVYVSERFPAGSGDINLDDAVNIYDVYYARLVAAKLIRPTEQQIRVGDVNGDGRINALDANIIRKYVAKVITSLPVAR